MTKDDLIRQIEQDPRVRTAIVTAVGSGLDLLPPAALGELTDPKGEARGEIAELIVEEIAEDEEVLERLAELLAPALLALLETDESGEADEEEEGTGEIGRDWGFKAGSYKRVRI